MTRIQLLIVVVALAAAALVGCLGDDQIIWGTLEGEYVVWGS